MERNEIIEMAIKAELNLYVHDLTEKQYIQVIETFAKLVSNREREACAKVCEQLEALSQGEDDPPPYRYYEAIRARGSNE